jgi:hypothetical protein
MWQSCYGERAGSRTNFTETKSRNGLRAETYDSLIFNTSNMPYLDEMDLLLSLSCGHQDWGRARAAGNRFARDDIELEPELEETITRRAA